MKLSDRCSLLSANSWVLLVSVETDGPTGQSWNGATLQCEAVFQTGRVRKVDIFTGTSIPDISPTGYLLMFSAQRQKNSWEHNRITEKWQFWGPESSSENIEFIFIIRCEKRMVAHPNCNSACCIIKNTGLDEACFLSTINPVNIPNHTSRCHDNLTNIPVGSVLLISI